MAQYQVPQDVEADDKLLGPFTFRQFIYLMIIGGLIGLGILFWQIFPPLIIVLIPPILLLGALALPIKKDQPMETYLSAVVSYYLKPHVRIWEPGEPESTIVITAPKKVEENRVKDLDQDEAMHRLSFLADIIDTEGYAIKGVTSNSGVRDDVYAEASGTLDMFDNPTSSNNSINQTLQENATARHDQVVSQMRAAIENNAQMQAQNATITHNNHQPSQPQPIAQPVTQSTSQPQSSMQPTVVTQPQPIQPPQPPALPQNETANITQPQPIAENPLSDEVVRTNDAIIKPDSVTEAIKAEEEKRNAEAEAKAAAEAAKAASQPNQSIIDLANNTDFSIETIAQQAKRIQEKKNDEVYISLH